MAGNERSRGIGWIGADWGTSSLRVWGFSGAGDIVARAGAAAGMGQLRPGDFEPVLLDAVGDWLPRRPARPVPVVICGMAGARQGWRDAGYRRVPCPALPERGGISVPCGDPRLAVTILPGLCQDEPADVMRGEETQLAGLIAAGNGEATVCMPGTHSKWARIENGQVARFQTFMTGELFALLREHSILRHSLGDTGDDTGGNTGGGPAFLSAVGETLRRPQSLTASLFSLRAGDLLRGTDAADNAAALSGLLIGAELAASRTWWEGRPVHLVGAPRLARTYAAALAKAGVAAIVEDGEALTVAGLRRGHDRLLEASA